MKFGHLILCGLMCALLAACKQSSPGAPSPGAAQPPAQASNPSIALNPAAGSAGTQVTIVGAGFPANAHVGLHMGAPGAGVGGQAHEATTDASGSFELVFEIPGQWPSGKPITEERLAILVATDDLSAQAYAEFGYIAPATPAPTPVQPTPTWTPPPMPADYPQDPREVVNRFLASLRDDPTGSHSQVYLASNLQAQVDGGLTVLQLLGLETIYQSFTVDVAGQSSQNTTAFQAILDLDTGAQARIFMLSQASGSQAWQITAIAAGTVEPPPPGDAGQVTHDFLIALLRDPSGQTSLNYLSRRLAAQVQGGQSVLSILQVQDVYTSFSYQVVSPTLIRVTLDYPQEAGPQVRTFTFIQEAGGWRIDTISP